jgi:adhesin transport system outer membrane protein
MIALLIAMLATAEAMTLEEAWTAVEARGQESALIEEQRLQGSLVRAQALAGLSPRISFGSNYILNQREVALDFGQSFPPQVIDLIEASTGEPVSFGEPRVIQQKDFFDANVTVTQALFNARTVPGLRAANALVRSGEAQARAGWGQLRLSVARAFWAVLVARDGAQLATEGLDLARQHADQVQKLVAAGNATRQATLQAEMSVARAERELAGAEARRTQAEQVFAALAEVPANTQLEVPQPRTLDYSDVEAALAAARETRPELRAATEQLRAARATTAAAKLAWAPTIDGRFTQMWTENTAFNGEPFNWLAGLNANWTIWDGGFRLAEQRRAASQYRAALEAHDKAAQDAEVEVRVAWEELNRARRARAAAEREVALATENLRFAEVSHTAGVTTFLDLEDARMAHENARLGLMAERMGEDVAALALLRAVGAL